MFIVSAPEIENRQLDLGHHHLVLPHLYEDEEYLGAYRRFAARGDFLLQDNSIFELKNVVGGDLVEFGKQIGATCIMVPEVLRDSKASLEAAEEFICKETTGKRFLLALAVQGKSYQEIKDHYVRVTSDPKFAAINIIAIPFNFEFDAYGNVDEEYKQLGWNRFSIVHRLIKDGVWCHDRAHHLLGLYNPIELQLYHPRIGLLNSQEYATIATNDSSSCYWHSLYNCQYTEQGLAYRKIESHVDFRSRFTHQSQYDSWCWNVLCMQRFLRGDGELPSSLLARLQVMKGYRL